MMSFIKRLFCFHPNWRWSWRKPPDWRTDIRWSECEDCGKLKNTGYLGVLPPSLRVALEDEK